MDNLSVLLGERIKNLRKTKNISQEALAHECGLQSAYIGQLERGEKNATIKSIDKVAKALGLTLEEVFYNLQPSLDKIDNGNETLITIYNLLQSRSQSDQKSLLKVLECLLDWKDTKVP